MPDLFPMFKLHRVDAAMVDIKNRHDHMDPGREIAARLQTARKEHAEAKTEADRLTGELKDAELQQKSIEEKRAKFDKQLYGGTIVNPREVEAFQREIEILKLQRDGLDERILELWETVPLAQGREKELAALEASVKAELDAYQVQVVEERTRLAAEYKSLAARRPPLVAAVPEALLQKYNLIKDKYGGIAMAEVTDIGTCGSCGTVLPRRSVLAASEDVFVQCESCHRILYKVAA